MAVTEEQQQARLAFGQALARVRSSRGWSQTQFRDQLVANGFAVSVGGVGMWETGKSAPDPTAMRTVETVLGAPGLGLILGVDTGALARLTSEVSELRDRVTAREERKSATSQGEDGGRHLQVAAEEGGDAHLAPPPTGDYHRPQPPPIEPELDEPGPEFGA